jgi:predicted restriction endonuclease
MVNQKVRIKVLEADGNCCIVCGFSGRSLGRSPILEAAHIIPETEGGPENLENLISLCVRCHRLLDMYHLFYFDPDTRKLILNPSCDAGSLGLIDEGVISCPDRIERGYLTRRQQIVRSHWHT